MEGPYCRGAELVLATSRGSRAELDFAVSNRVSSEFFAPAIRVHDLVYEICHRNCALLLCAFFSGAGGIGCTAESVVPCVYAREEAIFERRFRTIESGAASMTRLWKLIMQKDGLLASCSYSSSSFLACLRCFCMIGIVLYDPGRNLTLPI